MCLIVPYLIFENHLVLNDLEENHNPHQKIMRFFPLLDYLTFTRAERTAVIILICLITLSFLFPRIYREFLLKNPQDTVVDFAFPEIDNSANHPNETIKFMPRGGERVGAFETFQFDPNTATEGDFLKLGLSKRVTTAILNYRNKGGKFYKKEDFAKIYTLRKEDYERLESWIFIPERSEKKLYISQDDKPASTVFPNASGFGNDFKTKPESPLTIDINRATESEWQQLRGIGPGYSRRIVNYREKLGGFSTVQQIAETYGLPDSTFLAIQPYLVNSPIFRFVSINTMSLEELKLHPYISNFQANAVHHYRQEHGPLKNMDDFRKILVFKESDWIRLSPYLDFRLANNE